MTVACARRNAPGDQRHLLRAAQRLVDESDLVEFQKIKTVIIEEVNLTKSLARKPMFSNMGWL